MYIRLSNINVTRGKKKCGFYIYSLFWEEDDTVRFVNTEFLTGLNLIDTYLTICNLILEFPLNLYGHYFWSFVRCFTF